MNHQDLGEVDAVDGVRSPGPPEQPSPVLSESGGHVSCRGIRGRSKRKKVRKKARARTNIWLAKCKSGSKVVHLRFRKIISFSDLCCVQRTISRCRKGNESVFSLRLTVLFLLHDTALVDGKEIPTNTLDVVSLVKSSSWQPPTSHKLELGKGKISEYECEGITRKMKLSFKTRPVTERLEELPKLISDDKNLDVLRILVEVSFNKSYFTRGRFLTWLVAMVRKMLSVQKQKSPCDLYKSVEVIILSVDYPQKHNKVQKGNKLVGIDVPEAEGLAWVENNVGEENLQKALDQLSWETQLCFSKKLISFHEYVNDKDYKKFLKYSTASQDQALPKSTPVEVENDDGTQYRESLITAEEKRENKTKNKKIKYTVKFLEEEAAGYMHIGVKERIHLAIYIGTHPPPIIAFRNWMLGKDSPLEFKERRELEKYFYMVDGSRGLGTHLEVNIKVCDGRILSQKLHKEFCVGDLKMMIEEDTRIPFKNQIISIDSRELQDDEKPEELSLSELDSLTLIDSRELIQ